VFELSSARSNGSRRPGDRRQARSEAIHHSDTRSLQVYKAATTFLEEAERYGFVDDDVLLQRLAEKGHPTALRLVDKRREFED
jgi:hypothetical protein